MIARSSGAKTIGSAADRAGPNSKEPASITAGGAQPQIPARKRCACMLPPNFRRRWRTPIKSFSMAAASGETPKCLLRERISAQAGTATLRYQHRLRVTMSLPCESRRAEDRRYREIATLKAYAGEGSGLAPAPESLMLDKGGLPGVLPLSGLGRWLPKGTPADPVATITGVPSGRRWCARQ